MSEQEKREQVRGLFDTIAPGYDHPSLRFFHRSAAALVEQLNLAGDETVLDVATGTGAVALELASSLPEGQVTAIDLSEGMLAQAREKLNARGHGNACLQQMDMTALELPRNHFDLVTGAFCIFFVDDMLGCLHGITPYIKPGGRIMLSSFAEGSFEPNSGLFLEDLRSFGVEPPPLSWQRIGDARRFTVLLESAGLEDVTVIHRNLSYHLPDTDAWWAFLWNAGYRGLIEQLDEERQQAFREHHLLHMASVQSSEGIPLRVEVLFASGRTP